MRRLALFLFWCLLGLVAMPIVTQVGRRAGVVK